jgi:hypothetical protein
VTPNIVTKKKDETRHRWETVIKDKNFNSLRILPVCETRPEHFDRVLADGQGLNECLSALCPGRR